MYVSSRALRAGTLVGALCAVVGLTAAPFGFASNASGVDLASAVVAVLFSAALFLAAGWHVGRAWPSDAPGAALRDATVAGGLGGLMMFSGPGSTWASVASAVPSWALVSSRELAPGSAGPVLAEAMGHMFAGHVVAFWGCVAVGSGIFRLGAWLAHRLGRTVAVDPPARLATWARVSADTLGYPLAVLMPAALVTGLTDLATSAARMAGPPSTAPVWAWSVTAAIALLPATAPRVGSPLERKLGWRTAWMIWWLGTLVVGCGAGWRVTDGPSPVPMAMFVGAAGLLVGARNIGTWSGEHPDSVGRAKLGDSFDAALLALATIALVAAPAVSIGLDLGRFVVPVARAAAGGAIDPVDLAAAAASARAFHLGAGLLLASVASVNAAVWALGRRMASPVSR